MPSLRTDFIKISNDSAIGQGIFRLAQDFSLERVVFIENYPSEGHAIEWARDCTPEVDKEFDRALTLSLRKLSRERYSQYLRPEELGLDSSISNIRSIGLIDVGQKSILCLFDSRAEPDWWGSPSLVSGYISGKEKKIAYLENSKKASLQSASDGSVEFLKKSSNILASSKDKIGLAFDVLEIGMKELGMDLGVYAKFNEDNSKFSLIAHSGIKPVLLAELEKGFGTGIEASSEALANSVSSICALDSVFSLPVLLNDKFSGALCFGSSKAQDLNEGQNSIFRHLSSILAFSENFSKRIESGRQHSRAVSFLYRMNKQLTWNTSLEKLFEIAFGLLKEELSLERQWVGILNESSTSITGQAAEGEGWRKKLVEISLDLSDSSSPLMKVIESKAILRLKDSAEFTKIPVLSRVYSRINLEEMVLVPMLSGDQLVGIFAAQRAEKDLEFTEKELALLQGMVNEIAFSVITRKKEDSWSEDEKMRTAGFFASGIAHNFNNLLQGIMGQASLLEIQSQKSTLIDSKIVLAASKVINDSAVKGGSFVKQLLGMAQVEISPRVQCSVASQLRSRLEKYQGIVGQEVSLTLTIDGELPPAQIDPEQLHRIVEELVKNARDSIDDQGKINIHCSLEEIGKAGVDFDIQSGNYLCVAVKDSGRGMNADQLKRCFEPFFTTKEVDPGSGLGMGGAGLGLSAAYALAKANEGRIAVDSSIGKGSTFRLYLKPVEEGLN